MIFHLFSVFPHVKIKKNFFWRFIRKLCPPTSPVRARDRGGRAVCTTLQQQVTLPWFGRHPPLPEQPAFSAPPPPVLNTPKGF